MAWSNGGRSCLTTTGNSIFFDPKNLPALVTMVYLEDGDIRESFFRRLDPTEPSQSSVGKWSQHVGGFLASFNIGKALPVRMTVCWDSVIDKNGV